jgi:hypothetical protein
VLKAGFDGSGEVASRYLTLSTIAADDAAWGMFEDQWDLVLKRFNVPYSHMNELAAKKKSKRSPFYGWPVSRALDFSVALVNVLGQMHPNLTLASSTLGMDDYRDLQRSTNESIEPAAAICVDYCMAGIMNHPRFRDGKAEMFFDKDEEFIQYVESVWSRNRRKQEHWAKYITTIAPVDMIDVPVVQGADLLAWSMNRYYSKRCGDDELDFDVWQTNAVMLEVLSNRSALYTRQEFIDHPGFFGWTAPANRKRGATGLG